MKLTLPFFALLFVNIYLFGGNITKENSFDNHSSNIINGCLEAEYGQYPVTTFTPICIGIVEEVTPMGWAGEYSTVSVSSGTEYIFSSSIASDYITIGNQNGTQVLSSGTGTVKWTSDTDGFIRFYTHLDSSCTSSNTTSRKRLIQCGELLSPPINDDCANAIALSCGDSGIGQTFSADDSGGRASKDVFFTYTGNGVPENITMSLCGSSFNTFVHVYSDCSLTNVIAFDDNSCNGLTSSDTSSSVSFTSDGFSTYVILVEGYSEEDFGNFVYELTCTNVPSPPQNCDDFEVLSSYGEETFFMATTQQRLALDLPVGENAFYGYGMNLNLITELNIFPTIVNFRFFEDDEGIPGNQVTTRTGTIINHEFVGSFFNIYVANKYLVKFETPVFFDANKRYWIEIETDAIGWEHSSVYGSLGYPDVRRSAATGVWEALENPQLNLVFEMICNELNVWDAETAVDFQYFPNPVKEILTFNSPVNIRSLTIYNSTGQKVTPNVSFKSKNEINLSSMARGVYMFHVVLENNQIETFKIIKE